LMPIAEEQAKFVTRYLTGQYALPPVDTMNAERVETHERGRQRHVASPRHTIQIDCNAYAMDLRRELARGQRRAEALMFALPVPPRIVRPAPRPAVDA